MKNILITGHKGFIGPLLIKLLVDKEYQVAGIDTEFFGSDCVLYDLHDGSTDIRKDVRHITESDLQGFDAVCHLAALSNDPIGELSSELTFQINYKASVRLARLAKLAGVKKFIFSSSCSMYGVAAGDEALTENAPFAPATAYAKSKVMVEKELATLADRNFCVTSLRNGTAYGISPKLRVDLVVNNLVGWAIATGEIKIMSDGTPWRPLIHAEDIARAFVAVIEAPSEAVNGQAFNTGANEENYRVHDIAEIIRNVLPHCRIAITGEHGADSRTYRVNFDKIKKRLPQFQPAWTLNKGVEQIVESYRRYGMHEGEFSSRRFIRLKQIKYLLERQLIDSEMYWIAQ